MANLLDYLEWRGDLPFSASPFNEVDAALLSHISTLDLRGIVPERAEPVPLPRAAELFFKTEEARRKSLGLLQPERILPMFRLMGTSERFADSALACFRSRISMKREEQFCAVTILLPDGTFCVSYRGTDDTIIGWKEDFDLATSEAVPAQNDAKRYLEDAARTFPGEILICGHSKGGNLAVYAASMADAEVQKRIRRVYNFDGPGFMGPFLEHDGYRNIADRTVTILSQNAMVGTLLEPVGKRVIVTSNAFGPLAHDGFTWEVLGKRFVRSEALSESSQRFDTAISVTIESMTNEERQAFVDELFDTLLSTGAETLTDLTKLTFNQAFEMIKRLRQDKRVSEFALKFFEEMLRSIRLPHLDELFRHKAEDGQ